MINGYIRILILFAVILAARLCYAETVGVILTDEVSFDETIHNSFMEALDKEKKKRIKFIIQRPHPDPISWSNAARKLIAAEVDLIITYGTSATLAVSAERPSVPVLFAGVHEALTPKIKLKNSAGVAIKTPITSILRYLRSCGPINSLGVIYNNLEEASVYQYSEIVKLSDKYNFKVVGLNLRQPADITGIVPDVKLDAILVTSASTADIAFPTILNFAKSRSIPTASIFVHDDHHAIVTLSADPVDIGRIAAEACSLILDGQPLKNISPAYPKSRLIFNMKEAKAMGLRIPMDLVAEATEIIY